MTKRYLLFFGLCGFFAVIALLPSRQETATEKSLSAEEGAPLQAVISVPSDSAKYELLELSRRAGGMVEITTVRRGKSGEGYSKRLVDCKNWTAKYLGDGDSLEKMKASKPDGDMWPLVKDSISSHIATYACRHSK